MSLVICPGIHDPEITQAFLAGLSASSKSLEILTFPAQDQPAYSALHILEFVSQSLQSQDIAQPPLQIPLVFIGFSAGVVGAIAAARLWQNQGGIVKALIAIDGWGVPLYGEFPIHRVSHDYFTHWSSALLGGGDRDSFYADPPVSHLELWRSPQTTLGHWVKSPLLTGYPPPSGTANASQFLIALLQQYGEYLISPSNWKSK